MQRRHLLLAGVSGFAPAVCAHHGWSSFDTDRPIFLEGTAGKVSWRNPHAEIELDVAASLKLPEGLAALPLPAQSTPVDGAAILAKTRLPTRKDKRWTLELAPLTRLQAWRLEEIKPGSPLAAIGYTFSGEKGSPVMRVEYLFVNSKGYGLRSSPV